MKQYLQQGITILFCGTPCQVAGLKKYLGRDWDNLFTIDFLCHGVPSPKVFDMYIKHLERERKSKVKAFSFRDKWRSWRLFNFKITFEDGNVVREFRTFNTFCNIFLRDFALSPCCYSCHYARHERNSDITIADYWERIGGNRCLGDGDKGISLCVVNSAKGKALLSICKDKLNIKKIDAEETLNSYKYFNSPTSKPKERSFFWSDVAKGNYALLAERYGYPMKSTIADRIMMKTGFPKKASLCSQIINKLEFMIRKRI